MFRNLHITDSQYTVCKLIYDENPVSWESLLTAIDIRNMNLSTLNIDIQYFPTFEALIKFFQNLKTENSQEDFFGNWNVQIQKNTSESYSTYFRTFIIWKFCYQLQHTNITNIEFKMLLRVITKNYGADLEKGFLRKSILQSFRLESSFRPRGS